MTTLLLTPKELGSELQRNARYVYAMVARGFRMPGGTATVAEARAWLTTNPCPRRRPIRSQSAVAPVRPCATAGSRPPRDSARCA